MKTMRRVSSVVAAGVVALSMSNLTHAFVQAQSVVEFTSFTMSDKDGVLDYNTDFQGLVFTSSADTTVSLTGFGSDGDSSNVIPIDLSLVCVGDCPEPNLTENGFEHLTSPPSGTYAAADTFETGTPVANIPGAGTVPADVKNGSWAAVLSGDAVGSSESNNELGSTWLFTFTGDGDPAGPGTRTLDFDFDLDAFVMVSVTGDEIAPSVAAASYSVILTLLNGSDGTEIDSWSQIVTRTINAPDLFGQDREFIAGTGGNTSVKWQVVGLSEGVQYQLSARITTEADVTRVPAPASIALFGLGLLGLSAFRRRRIS